MKKGIYLLILPLVVVGGLVFANRGLKNETAAKPVAKPLTAAEMKAGRETWEATPDGILYKKWEASPVGKKVLSSAAKIKPHINAFTDMEAVITSLSLPAGSRLGFGVMARIDGEDYILRFEPDESQLEQLRRLKVADKIIIRSQIVSHAPKYSYAIVRADYAQRNGKVIYKRVPPKGGC